MTRPTRTDISAKDVGNVLGSVLEGLAEGAARAERDRTMRNEKYRRAMRVIDAMIDGGVDVRDAIQLVYWQRELRPLGCTSMSDKWALERIYGV